MRCGLWYPFRRRLLDLGRGGPGGGEGRGGTGGLGGLGWLRLRKCWTWSAGTPARSRLYSSTPYLFTAFGPLFTHSRHNLLHKLTQPVQLVPTKKFYTKGS